MTPDAGSAMGGIGRVRVAPVSVADAAEEHLRTLLFSGALTPGQELRDTVIASEMGIARPTARTAVQRLVSEGLLHREPGHSARVRTVTAADVVDLYGVRELVESAAVRRITAQRRDTSAVAHALARFGEAGESWEAGPDADAAFHSAVVAAAGSPRLSRMFTAIVSEMRLMIALLRGRYSSLSELFAEHTALLESLEAGDTERALALWHDHIQDAQAFLTEAVGENGGPGAEPPPGATLASKATTSKKTRTGLI